MKSDGQINQFNNTNAFDALLLKRVAPSDHSFRKLQVQKGESKSHIAYKTVE